MAQFCIHCGAPANPGAKFCSSCGIEIKKETAPGGGAIVHAPAESIAPGYAIVGSNIGLSDSLKRFFRNPKQLLPMVGLALFWLVLSLMPPLGINPWPVRFLSFLTFAQGGMYGGVVGALGGIIGKALFAYFFSALLLPLFSGKNHFKALGTGFKSLAAGMALQGISAAAELMLGLGLALVLFNFFTGNANPVNSMAGIVGCLLALKALLSRGDLLRNLVLTAANKLSRGKTPKPLTVNRVIAGYGAGSALGIAISAVPLPYLAYILGALIFIVGLVMGIATKPGKEVPAV